MKEQSFRDFGSGKGPKDEKLALVKLDANSCAETKLLSQDEVEKWQRYCEICKVTFKTCEKWKTHAVDKHQHVFFEQMEDGSVIKQNTLRLAQRVAERIDNKGDRMTCAFNCN